MAFCAKCGKELPAGSAFCPSCGAPASQAGASPQTPATGFDTLTKDSRAQGHWVRRFVAFVVDVIIVDVVIGIVAFFLAVPFIFVGGIAMFVSVIGGVFSVASGIGLVFYFAITEVAAGASVGKFLMGLRVKTTSGGAPSFAQTLVRNISKVFWLLLLLDVVVGLATSKGYSQKYSDRFIGTDVVSV
jgi:uncharacterized RDD family membrane protein YckC